MTDSLPEAQSKSGLILKAAREEMSLSLEQVAKELHLRPAVVKAIEDENYDEFPSDVFLKGYFRTYCRLVNLHESRMMGLLDQQLISRQNKAEHIKEQANKEVKLRKRKRLIITLMVFFTLSLLVVFVYQMVSGYNFGTQVEAEQPVQNTSTNTNADQPESSEESRIKAETDSNLINDSATDPLNQANSGTGNISSDAKVSSQESSADSSGNGPDINEPVESDDIIQENEFEEPIESLSTPTITNNVSTLNASFSGECWFKVTDSRGKVVIAALKKANDEVSYEGSAPFNVVIGDASQVSLTFQGDVIDLKPYTSRNGRAELTLKPSDINNEG